MLLVGGTRGVTSSADNNMKLQAGITLGVECVGVACIRACILMASFDCVNARTRRIKTNTCERLYWLYWLY